MTYQNSHETTYRVEISGWNASGNFFVEKTTVQWSPDTGKEVAMRASLREGDIVFVRLNQTSTAAPAFPIAYLAEKISSRDSRGFVRVSLVRLRPRGLDKVDPLDSASDAGNGSTQTGEGFAFIEIGEKA